jgi:DNA-binding transcriptional ArsR family regulator
MSPHPLNPEMLELIAGRFKALSEPPRLRILGALREGPRTVTELVDETGLGQTNVSKHLALLRNAGLVVRHRSGSFIHYAIGDQRLYTLCDLMCDKVRSDALARQEAVA